MSAAKKQPAKKKSAPTRPKNLTFETRDGCDWLTATLKSGRRASICLQHLELSATATRIFKRWAREQ